MPRTNEDLIKRADATIAQFDTDGGLLSPEQSNTFIDYILEEATVLPQVRVVRMNSPEVKVNRMGFGSRILRAARTAGSAEDDGSNGRYVRKADRAAPTTSQIVLRDSEVIAEVRLPYELLEDNIEGRSLEEHIMRQIAQRVAVDLEEFGLWADTANTADPYLALQDGWMKRANKHIVDNAAAGISPDVVANALLALPQKYLRNLAQMKGFISHANTIKYRQVVSKRETGYGDTALQNNIPLMAHGLRLEPASMLVAEPEPVTPPANWAAGNKGLVTHPQNLLWGIRRDISVETDKDIRSREYIIVVTARVATQIDDAEAVVRIDNI